jgi:hypothetical protein
MALRNRVTPFGEIVAVAGRGTLMGNRGVLHNREREVVRDWQVRRWIACRLEFRGRHREVMTPGSYTELFFLDEAAALADGHRPCAECRHADYVRFQTAWRSACGLRQAPSAEWIDTVLHDERRSAPWQKRTYAADIASLPDGSYIALDERAWLVHGEWVHAWSPDSYVEHQRRPASGVVRVLTPTSIVAALRAGYRSRVHPSSLQLSAISHQQKNHDH